MPFKYRNIDSIYHLVGDGEAAMAWIAGDAESNQPPKPLVYLVEGESPPIEDKTQNDGVSGSAADEQGAVVAAVPLPAEEPASDVEHPAEAPSVSLGTDFGSTVSIELRDWEALVRGEDLFDRGYPFQIDSYDQEDTSAVGPDFAWHANPGDQNASAHRLTPVDGESNARPDGVGNGGGNGGGGGNGNKDDDGSDPNVLSEYLSGPEGGYNILVDFKGSWTSTLQDAFVDSAELISSFVVGDLQDVFYRGDIIDDLQITAELTDIDGTGGVLGQAGPTAVRTSNYLPAVGEMEFDVADAEAFFDIGLWDEIVLHEMLHTVGFGTIWELKGLVAGSGTDTPTFTGEQATLAYESLFGVEGATGVPLEEDGGPGTAESHWDEETFGGELMTGYLNSSGNYLSDMTVASLEDLGYDTTWNAPVVA